jgi:hypothetical protein
MRFEKMVKRVLGCKLRCAPPCALDIEIYPRSGWRGGRFPVDRRNERNYHLAAGTGGPDPVSGYDHPGYREDRRRMVDRNTCRYGPAYKFMTRLKPEHADNKLLFEKLAALTHLPAKGFIERYGNLME